LAPKRAGSTSPSANLRYNVSLPIRSRQVFSKNAVLVMKSGEIAGTSFLRRAVFALALAVVANASIGAAKDTTQMSCDLEIKTISNAGVSKAGRETSVLEIQELDTSTSIRLRSALMPLLVTTARVGAVTVFVDNSNDAKWDISSIRKRGALEPDDERIILDRKTGEMNAYRSVTSNSLTTSDSATGSCKPLGTKQPGAS